MDRQLDFLMIGKRIAEERRLLGFSQANFADAVGVSLSTQKRYEKGECKPSASYLKSLSDIGIDAFLVLHGEEANEIRGEILGVSDMAEVAHSRNESLRTLLLSLGVDLGAWNMALERLLPISIESSAGVGRNNGPSVMIDATGGELLVSELIRLSPILSKKINESRELSLSMLSDIVEGFETVQKHSGNDICPAKKAQAVVMLYRAFKASGKVDQKMIEEAVKLASG